MCDKLFHFCTGETLEIAQDEARDMEMQNGGGGGNGGNDSTMIDHGDEDAGATAMILPHRLRIDHIDDHHDDDDDEEEEGEGELKAAAANVAPSNGKTKNKIKKMKEKVAEAENSTIMNAR